MAAAAGHFCKSAPSAVGHSVAIIRYNRNEVKPKGTYFASFPAYSQLFASLRLPVRFAEPFGESFGQSGSLLISLNDSVNCSVNCFGGGDGGTSRAG